MDLKKLVAFIILGLVAAHLEAVPTPKIEEQRLEEEILKADHSAINERSKKSVLLLNNQLPITSQTYNLPLQSVQTLGLQPPSSQTVETLIQPNAQLLNVQSVPQTVETVSIQSSQPAQLLNIQSGPRTVETVSVQQPVQTINVQPNVQPLVSIQSLPQTVETVNVLPNGQQLLNVQSLPQTVETVSIQSNGQPAQQLLNIQSGPRTVETVSVQQPVQTISVQPNGQQLLNIQSLPQTVETVSIQSNSQPAQQLLNIQSGPRTVETVSVQSVPQTLSLQSNGVQQLVNVQSVPQLVETLNVQQPLQTLNLQAGGQPVVQTLFPQSSATVVAQPPALPLPVPAQNNVVSVKEVQVESVAVPSVPSSVVEIAQGFVNPLAEEVIVSPSLGEVSLAPASERVVVSPSTSSFFATINSEPAKPYANVPQVYYNPRQPLTVVPSSSRVVSRVL